MGCQRFYADFTGADPRCREPKRQPETPSCPTDGAAPAWTAEPEPLRKAV